MIILFMQKFVDFCEFVRVVRNLSSASKWAKFFEVERRRRNKILIFIFLFKKPYDLLKPAENSLHSPLLKNTQPHTSLTTRPIKTTETGRKSVRFRIFSQTQVTPEGSVSFLHRKCKPELGNTLDSSSP
jgi:hypothetical protein